MSTLQRAALFAVSFVFSAVAFGQTANPDVPPYFKDPKFRAALSEGYTLMANHQPFADDAFKKANKLAGGQCPKCVDGLFHAQMAGRDYKAALATCNLRLSFATTPAEKGLALTWRGQALVAQAGDKPKPAQLEAAHATFQEALANSPKDVNALFQDGRVLAKIGNMEDASAEFKKCAECLSPKDTAKLRAEHFAANPELSTHQMAPVFEVTALDGSKFNLDAMGGRVVLIDFWATWCGPCNAELPNLKKIAKDFAGQPLVIISVSWDSDEAKWKQFIQKNEMTWVQYRDADHKLSENFGINAIPHYFTIDADGVLTAEMLGEGNDVEGKLKKLVAKAKQAQAQSTVTAGY